MVKKHKKIMKIFITIIMLFMLVGLSGCLNSYPVYYFEDLIELQSAMRDDVYFFTFKGVDFNEVGEFRAFRTHEHNQEGEPWFFRYHIRDFEVKCEVLGRAFPFEIVASYNIHPFTIGAVTHLDFEFRDGKAISFRHVERNIRERNYSLIAILNFENAGKEAHYYFYYFIMRGVQQILCQEELDFFKALVEHAISNRYVAK